MKRNKVWPYLLIYVLFILLILVVPVEDKPSKPNQEFWDEVLKDYSEEDKQQAVLIIDDLTDKQYNVEEILIKVWQIPQEK